MLVHTQGGVYDLHEEMLYMSADHSCAVFMVTRLFGGTFRSYDLRLRNSSVAKGPRKDCVRKLKRRDRRVQVIYRPMCQDILHSEAPTTMPNSTVKG
uniref:Lipocalin n=1 Tax=Rhipicephalus zambeziensis TaxID=60191 RepID=A0A224YMZ6_9ACAR